MNKKFTHSLTYRIANGVSFITENFTCFTEAWSRAGRIIKNKESNVFDLLLHCNEDGIIIGFSKGESK